MKLKLAAHARHLPVAMAALVLAACGGGGGGGGGSTGTASAPVATSAAPVAASASSTGTLVLSAQSASVLRLDGKQLPDYTPQLPPHFAGVQAQDNTPAGTVSTPVMATLGRVLFHEKALSVSGKVSCASCHNQAQDFADLTRFSL